MYDKEIASFNKENKEPINYKAFNLMTLLTIKTFT